MGTVVDFRFWSRPNGVLGLIFSILNFFFVFLIFLEGDLTAVSKDELFGKFFAALEKNHYFKTNIDGGDDQEQLEKACRLFEDGFMVWHIIYAYVTFPADVET